MAGGMALEPLPIDAFLAEIRAQVDRHRALILSAAPGAGKSTRVPPALTAAGPVILLQPRRVAARAVATRIAQEQGWSIGREVGWQIRFERRYSRETRLLVVTEGILAARLQQDPLLSDFTTIVLDEFHERSVHADVGVALAKQAWRARNDLRIVVMSATLDVSGVARFLDGAPVLTVPGVPHPLAVDYSPAQSVGDAVRELVPRTHGHVLCFLPGRREIERAQEELTTWTARSHLDVVALHGSLDGAAQDAAIRVSPGRRVILATNVAETSLTVPGVSVVVDTGQVKVARYDADRGVDTLSLERVTQDSADQRAGRAARLGPGLVRRLWPASDRLRPHREPEISRVDLAAPVLDLIAWGADPLSFEWFEPPPAGRVEAALGLLVRLGAIDRATAPSRAPRLTSLGRQLARVSVHPRLARILLDGQGAPEVAAACALLSEGLTQRNGTGATTTCDLLPLVDRFAQQPFHVQRIADELRRMASGALNGSVVAHASDEMLRHALFTGYADRLGRRRSSARDRVTLASGHGAALARESGVSDGDYLVALDVVSATREGIDEARIYCASRVEREWIVPSSTQVEHRIDESNRVRAARVARFGAIVISETPVAVEPETAAVLLRDAWLARQPDGPDAAIIRRLRFAGIEVDLSAIVLQAAATARALEEIALEPHLPFEVRRSLAALAPSSIVVPSGRSTTLEYGEDGSVSASVKLQELFGLAETPTVGPRRVPILFHLLAPNGRTVQTTRDLRSFWATTYPEVRKELRGRYPKHPWPDDPWTAPATHRTTKKR
jgi:ATP-dependent helicase HrpB